MNSISCKNLSKTYFIEKESLLVLKNIDLIINEGDRLAITGKSGSGKSSLLHIFRNWMMIVKSFNRFVYYNINS